MAEDLLLRPIVNDADIVDVRADEFDEVFVSRVWQISVASLLVRERHEEAVRETLRLAFRANVRAPLKIADRVDLAGQAAEAGFNLLDLFLGRPFFEFEEHDMPHSSQWQP